MINLEELVTKAVQDRITLLSDKLTLAEDQIVLLTKKNTELESERALLFKHRESAIRCYLAYQDALEILIPDVMIRYRLTAIMHTNLGIEPFCIGLTFKDHGVHI